MTEECAPVRIDEQAFAHAADLIARDLTATLGWGAARAQAEGRAALGNRAGWLPITLAWDEIDPATQPEILDEVVVGAVEDLQQFLARHLRGHLLAGVPTPPEPSHVAYGGRARWQRVVLPYRGSRFRVTASRRAAQWTTGHGPCLSPARAILCRRSDGRSGHDGEDAATAESALQPHLDGGRALHRLAKTGRVASRAPTTCVRPLHYRWRTHTDSRGAFWTDVAATPRLRFANEMGCIRSTPNLAYSFLGHNGLSL